MPRNNRKIAIFRPYRTNPLTGQREYASQFGKKAFVFWIDPDKPRKGGGY